LSESFSARTRKLISQLTKCEPEQLSKWEKISGRIAIVISKQASQTPNARLALALSVNCLSRVYPIVTELDVVIPDDINHRLEAPLFEGQTTRNCIELFVEKLKPEVKVRVVNKFEDRYDAVLSIGNTDYNNPFKISVSSDGWLAFASPKSLSQEFTDNTNPIGAYAAANLGAAEIFKKILIKKTNSIVPSWSEYDFRWITHFLNKELLFNTFDYSLDKKKSVNPSLPDVVDIDHLTVAGVGAGGGSCLYTLASLTTFKGVFHLIDPDEIKDSNLNRYVYATHSDAEKNIPKVHAMRQLLSNHRNCTIKPYHTNYGEFSKQTNSSPIDVLISTVDTNKARVAIQWDFPATIFDAAVIRSQFYVNRVEFGKNACLGCRFLADGPSESLETHLSKITGIPVDTITTLITNNAPIEKHHIEIMKSFSEKNKFPLPKVGDHFQDWYQYHCGELKLDDSNILIPLPFATIMPGILVAGEVIKRRYFSNNNNGPNFFSYDIFGLKVDPTNTIKRRPDCQICSNEKTVQRYKEKHNIKDQD